MREKYHWFYGGHICDSKFAAICRPITKPVYIVEVNTVVSPQRAKFFIGEFQSIDKTAHIHVLCKGCNAGKIGIA